MPTYLSFADLEAAVGGVDALRLIADPTFTNSAADPVLVDEALEYGEGVLLRYCRAAPLTSGLSSWVDTPANLPQQANDAIVSLAVHRLHEQVRGVQGYAIPKGAIDSKDAVYSSFEGLSNGLVSWTSAAAPASTLTQKTRVYTDPNARGRRALSGAVRKLIG